MNDYLHAHKHAIRPLPLVGLAMVAASLLFLLLAGRQAMTGWLVAAAFWCGVPVGALAWVMVHHLTGGRWGGVVRPAMEAAAVTVPVTSLLIVPPLIACGWTFPWGNATLIAASETLQHQQAWVWPPWVWLRLAVYVVPASVFAFALWKARRPMASLSAPGLILIGVLGSFAALDFLMTRTVGYVSSIFGFIVVVGWAYSAWTLAVIVEADAEGVDNDRRNDLGSLLATMALLWAYLSFMQFLISWLGNKLPEATWYARRGLGGIEVNGWRWVGLSLFLVTFAAPFGMMLFRSVKRNAKRLRVAAGVAVAGRLLDCLWLAGPSDIPGGFGVWSVTVAVMVLVGFGLFWWPLWASLRAATPAVVVEDTRKERVARHVAASR